MTQRIGLVVAVVGSLALGVLVAAVGTVMHRSVRPWGLVLVLATALAVAVLARAWGRYAGLAAYGTGLIVVCALLAAEGPGGDVLVPAGDAWGLIWLVGSALAVGVAAFAPSRWFADGPVDPPGAAPGQVADVVHDRT